jgi:glycosyltransferase involved in cell wall biosynthesis
MKKIKKKKLLFVMPNLDGGGAQLVLLSLIKYLDRDKYEIGLFLFRNEGEAHYLASIPEDVVVEAVFERGAARLRARYEYSYLFIRLVRFAYQYNIIIGSLELSPTFLAYFTARLLGKLCVGWVHTAIEPYTKDTESSFFCKVAHFVYPRLDAVVFVSNGAYDSMKSFLGGKKIIRGETIYNILDYPIIKQTKTEFESDGKERIVVAAGRLVSLKGFDLLIQAHAKLIANHLYHKLVILGEGPLRSELETIARVLGVSESVVLEGYVENPFDYFRKAEVFVLSSRFEGLGMVMLEAMMAGTPVIATDCPYGPAEVLENGKYGLLVRTEDADSLAEGIERMFSDIGLREQLKLSGRLRAADFSAERLIPQWDRLFETL